LASKRQQAGQRRGTSRTCRGTSEDNSRKKENRKEKKNRKEKNRKSRNRNNRSSKQKQARRVNLGALHL